MYSKKRLIPTMREGERVEDIFVVKIKRGFSVYSKGYSFHLILSDASGLSIDCKYWGDINESKVREVYDSIKADDVVLVKGRAEMYNGKLQMSVNPPDTIRPLVEGEFDKDEFIMAPKRDIEEMVKELQAFISGVQNPEIRNALEKVFFSGSTFMDKFKTHPGAIEIHHNWKGGLIQHTLEVAKFCELAAKLSPDLNKDLLIAGALLHDIGKVEEIETTTRIKGTRKGQLKGHIVLGFLFLSKVLEELGTSEDVKDKLLHIIISHHGHNEYGSPKQPMFAEAVAVYYADEMSSKITEMTDFIRSARDATEDEFMYHRRHNTNVFLR